MKVYLGFDDTDTCESPYGTGKLVRWFQDAMPQGFKCLGVVRQQLLVCDAIPYTSHNSAACLIADMPEPDLLPAAIECAAGHLKQYALEGSDPGLCVVAESDPAGESLVAFGQRCTRAVCTQSQAVAAAKKAHLSGHGGTNDGIIGAAAAVGLTICGWSGRFIERGHLRDLAEEVSVAELNRMDIGVVSMDRDARVPAPADRVRGNGWLRPRLLGHRPVLLVSPLENGRWETIDRKRAPKSDHQKKHEPIQANG
jgi:hypothetical protein